MIAFFSGDEDEPTGAGKRGAHAQCEEDFFLEAFLVQGFADEHAVRLPEVGHAGAEACAGDGEEVGGPEAVDMDEGELAGEDVGGEGFAQGARAERRADARGEVPVHAGGADDGPGGVCGWRGLGVGVQAETIVAGAQRLRDVQKRGGRAPGLHVDRLNNHGDIKHGRTGSLKAGRYTSLQEKRGL